MSLSSLWIKGREKVCVFGCWESKHLRQIQTLNWLCGDGGSLDVNSQLAKPWFSPHNPKTLCDFSKFAASLSVQHESYKLGYNVDIKVWQTVHGTPSHVKAAAKMLHFPFNFNEIPCCPVAAIQAAGGVQNVADSCGNWSLEQGNANIMAPNVTSLKAIDYLLINVI